MIEQSDYLTLVKIYEEAEKIDCNTNEAIGSLKSLLQRYRKISDKYSDFKQIPLLDESTDVDMFYKGLCGDGPQKLTDLKVEINVIIHKYEEQDKTTPPKMDPSLKQGWNPGHVLTVVAIIIGGLITISIAVCIWMYDRGKDVAVFDNENEFQQQKVLLDSLKKANSYYTDSINVLQDSLSASKKSLDSLRKEYVDKDLSFLYIYEQYKKSSDSLHNPAICSMNGGNK